MIIGIEKSSHSSNKPGKRAKSNQLELRLRNSDSDDSMLNLENPAFNTKEDELCETVEMPRRTPSLNASQPQENTACNAQSVSVVLADDPKRDEHCHPLRNEGMRNRTVWRKLITVLILCVFFMIAEIVGGIIAKSISIQTDAAHMAADIAGFFFSILAIYVSGKGKQKMFAIENSKN